MKKLFTLIIMASLALTIQAQDNIVNTLGAAGRYKVDKSDGTNILNLDYTGNLYLGGTSGPFNARMLNLVKEGSSTGITLTTYKNSNIARSRINFSMANGTIGSPSILADNDEVSFLDFYGYDGNSFDIGAAITVHVDGSVSDGNVPMEIDFQTGGTTSRLKIKGDGKIGIGTETPKSTLDVHGSMSLPIRNVVSSTTLDESDYTVTATGTSFTVYIPQATSGNKGRVYVIKHGGGNGDTIIVDVTGSGTDAADEIDGSTTQSLSKAWSSMMVQSTGATWVIIASK